MKTTRLASLLPAAFLIAISSNDVAIAEAKQQCSAAIPSHTQSHWWSYRLIDGRKCWYEGKPGLSKSLLEWPKEESVRPASAEEVTGSVPDKALTGLDAQAWAPNSQPSPNSKTSPSSQTLPNLQAALPKPEALPPTPQALPPTSQTLPPTPRPSQPSATDTFEAQWRARAIEEAARLTGAGPGTSEVDDKPPLKKADKLPSQFDGAQTKAVHTLVIVPDQSLPLSTGLSRRSGLATPAPSPQASPGLRE